MNGEQGAKQKASFSSKVEVEQGGKEVKREHKTEGGRGEVGMRGKEEDREQCEGVVEKKWPWFRQPSPPAQTGPGQPKPAHGQPSRGVWAKPSPPSTGLPPSAH